MALTTQAIPSLLNGVSQQPPSVRHPTQAEEQTNALSSLSSGLEKRPPTQHVAKLINTPLPAADPGVHHIQVSSANQFVALFNKNNVSVFDVSTGAAQTVAYSDYTEKLLKKTAAAELARVRLVYIPDAASTILLASQVGSGTVVWEKADDAAFTTNVVELRSDTTTTSATVAWAPGTDNGKYIRARVTGYTSGTVEADATWKATNYLQAAAPRGTFKAISIADTTFVLNTDISVQLDEETGYAAVTGTSQTFAALPAASEGEIYEVVGDQATKFDNYHVKFTGGIWRETYGPGLKNGFNQLTMPHILTYDGTTFTFGVGQWDGRSVGDSDSAKEPPFVGKEIQDVFFFRDRLGICAGESVVLSRVGTAPGGYFNFWPETVTAILDSDPVIRSAPHRRISKYDNAVPFDKSLLLFSEEAQFVMNAGALLTPETARVDIATEFNSSASVKPFGIGQNVYFAEDKGSFTGVREYFVEPETVTNDAADVTAHVPTYIPTGAFRLTGSSNEDIMFALTSGAASTLFVYKFHWRGSEKTQSSWSRWELGTEETLLGAEMRASTLHLVSKRSDGIHLLKMELASDASTAVVGERVHLDRRATLTGVYNSGSDLTTWTLPYETSSAVTVVQGTGFTSPGHELTTSKPTSTTVTASGDYSGGACLVGTEYTTSYTLSEQFIQTQTSSGSPTATLGGRLQLRQMSVRHFETGNYQVTVKPKARDTQTYTFSGKVLGDSTLVLGQLSRNTGTFKVPLLGRSSQLDITLLNDTWRASSWLSVEWTGLFSGRSVIQ